METYFQCQSVCFFCQFHCIYTYIFFQAPAAMALKLHCNKDFPWTERERNIRRSKWNSRMLLPIHISSGSALRVGCSMTGEDRGDGSAAEEATAMAVLLSCCHRVGDTHSDTENPPCGWPPFTECAPIFTFPSLSFSFPVNQNRHFPIYLLLLPAFLKPLLLPGLPQCTSHKLTMGQFPLVTAWVRKGSL